MAKMPEEVIALFNDPEASKVLATMDTEGKLNVVFHRVFVSNR